MRSRRSFFNFTVLRKDITRFFPVWGLFCVFLGLVWLSLHMSGARYIGRELMGFFTLASPWIAAYALICAVTLFGDLFQSRLCNALHAMPLRREGWFFTHAAAGALFFLVPFGLFCFLTVPLGVRWGFGGIEFLLGTLEYALFFGMALLCVMLTGNRVGTVLLFGLLNFLAPILQWIAETVYQPVLYGVPLHADFFAYFSPVLQLSAAAETLFDNYMTYGVGVTLADWRYVLICGGIGAAMLTGALFLYRCRALETAGDFISVRFLRPVFVAAFSLVVAVALFDIMGHDAEELVFLILYLAIGFFFGRMLVMRTVRVFQPLSFLWYGALVAVLFGSLGLCRLDPVGITRKVPQPEQVRWVEANLDQSVIQGDYYSSYFSGGDPISDPEHIAILLQFHKDCTQSRPSAAGRTGMVYLSYHLQNGTVLRRYYPIELVKEGQQLLPVFSSWDAVFDGISQEELTRRVRSIRAIGTNSELGIYFGEGKSPYHRNDVLIQSPTLQTKLLKLLKEDCLRGNMAQYWQLYGEYPEAEGSLEIWLEGENGAADTCLYLTVYPFTDTFFFINTCYSQGRIQEDRTLTEENLDLSFFSGF